MFGEGLFNYLANNAGLIAILGPSRGDKAKGIWAQLAPDEPTMPYMTYTQISGSPVETYEGMNRFTEARYRFSCYGSSYGQAKKLAEALRQAFSSYRATLSDGTVLESSQHVMEADDAQSVPHGTIYASHVDMMFLYVNNS